MTDPNAGQPMPARQQIEALHGLYVRLTGHQVRLDMSREAVWFEWRRRGFTADDLQFVIRELRAAIARGDRNPGALKFSNLIGQPDFFEEDLAALRAKARPGPPTTRTVRTGDTTRIVADPGTAPRAVPIGDVIAAMRQAAGRRNED